MKVGILTGGGDVPGLNASIKAVVMRMASEGHQVTGIRRGWAGLLEIDPDDPLDARRSRHPVGPRRGAHDRPDRWHVPAHIPDESGQGAADGGAGVPGAGPRGRRPADHTAHVLRVLDHLGLDALIPIGGDDTLSFALRLSDEGVPVVAIPKTMDNDVHGTDYCIGFSTADHPHRDLHPSAAHERGVARAAGDRGGVRALQRRDVARVRVPVRRRPGDHLGGAVRHREAGRVARSRDKRANPSRYAMMTISEGATLIGGEMVQDGREDAYGHRKLGGVGQLTSELLHEITGEGVIYQQIGYLMRSGSPDSLDLMVAINYAVMAADLVIEGTTGRLVALRNGNYANVPLGVTRQGVKRVDVDSLYDNGALPAEDPPRRRQTDVPILTRPWLPTGSISVRTPSTSPSPAMRRAMAEAEVGDDWYGDDPTVNRLQERAAEVTGKEAALYVPTGTMANQIGVRLHVTAVGPPGRRDDGRPRRQHRADDVRGPVGHRVPDGRPRSAGMDDGGARAGARRAGGSLRRRGRRPAGGREHASGTPAARVMPVEELRAIRKVADDNGAADPPGRRADLQRGRRGAGSTCRSTRARSTR